MSRPFAFFALHCSIINLTAPLVLANSRFTNRPNRAMGLQPTALDRRSNLHGQHYGLPSERPKIPLAFPPRARKLGRPLGPTQFPLRLIQIVQEFAPYDFALTGVNVLDEVEPIVVLVFQGYLDLPGSTNVTLAVIAQSSDVVAAVRFNPQLHSAIRSGEEMTQRITLTQFEPHACIDYPRSVVPNCSSHLNQPFLAERMRFSQCWQSLIQRARNCLGVTLLEGIRTSACQS